MATLRYMVTGLALAVLIYVVLDIVAATIVVVGGMFIAAFRG